jgi:hypothetical protein
MQRKYQTTRFNVAGALAAAAAPYSLRGARLVRDASAKQC